MLAQTKNAILRTHGVLSRMLAVVTAFVLMASAAMAQVADPQIVTDAKTKLDELGSHASSLGTGLLGFVAIIAVITLAVKFLRR